MTLGVVDFSLQSLLLLQDMSKNDDINTDIKTERNVDKNIHVKTISDMNSERIKAIRIKRITTIDDIDNNFMTENNQLSNSTTEYAVSIRKTNKNDYNKSNNRISNYSNYRDSSSRDITTSGNGRDSSRDSRGVLSGRVGDLTERNRPQGGLHGLQLGEGVVRFLAM